MKTLNQLLKMIVFTINILCKLRRLFKLGKVPSIRVTSGFNVFKNPMKFFEISLNNNYPIVQTARKKLGNSFIHETNIRNKCLNMNNHLFIQ